MPSKEVEGVDIRLLARWHRRLRWLLVVAVVGYVPLTLLPYLRVPRPLYLSVPYVIVYLLVLAILAIGGVQVARVLRMGRVAIITCACLMVLPYAALFLLLGINIMASTTLRNAGLHVGLLGVKDEEVVRVLCPNLCRQCGYDLTGNVSGRCPECGTAIARGEALRLAPLTGLAAR